MNRILLGIAGLLLAFTVAAAAAPRLDVDAEVHEFGSVVEGYAVSHTFVLMNVGDEPLHIDRVRASCGCTTAALATQDLEPGESVDLAIVVNTTGFSGNISKTIYVYSNDPSRSSDQSDLVLYVRGTVTRAEPYHKTVNDMFYYFVPLIDLRDPDAYAAGHLLGAVNVPLATLEDSLDRLPKDGLLVLYDESGASSSGALIDLVQNGRDARLLDGGLAAWSKAYGSTFVLPPVVPDGSIEPVTANVNHVYAISAADVHRVFYVLVDLRSKAAYAQGHLFGAINIPSSEFEVARLSMWLGDVPLDTEIILYGQTSAPSDAAAQILLTAGYSRVRSLLGGLDEWVRQFGDRLMILSTEE